MYQGLRSSLTLSGCLVSGAAAINVIFLIVAREDFDICPHVPAYGLNRARSWGRSVGSALLGFWPLSVLGPQDPEVIILAGCTMVGLWVLVEPWGCG